MKTIAFDLSSGDKGSTEAIKAAVDFSLSNKDWKIIGFSYEEIDTKNLPKNFEVVKCTQVIEMTDGPLQVRRKKDSTLVKAIEYVLEGKADGVVSAAASGPLVTAGFLMFNSIEGTKPAFAPIFENIKGKQMVALDIGANIDADAKTLEQYAIMGTVFAKVMGISKEPRVWQLNIGTEDKKGTQLQQEAFELMKNNETINFKGNVEATEIITSDEIDVIVSEAYSGNIAIKSFEGMLMGVKSIIKNSINDSLLDKIGFGVFTKKFRKDLKSFATGLQGGAIVLGLNNILIKSHGSSEAEEFKEGLNTAKELIEKDLIKLIKEAI